MSQQISVEAALAAFRQRCSELTDENVLLKARANEVEEENTRLRLQLEATEAQPVAAEDSQSAAHSPLPG